MPPSSTQNREVSIHSPKRSTPLYRTSGIPLEVFSPMRNSQVGMPAQLTSHLIGKVILLTLNQGSRNRFDFQALPAELRQAVFHYWILDNTTHSSYLKTPTTNTQRSRTFQSIRKATQALRRDLFDVLSSTIKLYTVFGKHKQFYDRKFALEAGPKVSNIRVLSSKPIPLK